MRDKVNTSARQDMKALLIKHGTITDEEGPETSEQNPQRNPEQEQKVEGDGLKELIFVELEKLKGNFQRYKSRVERIENQFMLLLEEKDKSLKRDLKNLTKDFHDNKDDVLIKLREKDKVQRQIEKKLSNTSDLLQNLLKVKSKSVLRHQTQPQIIVPQDLEESKALSYAETPRSPAND